MIGGSYGGQIQYAVAMQDKRVDALIPIITWNDLSYSLAPNNTSLTRGVTYATPGVGKREWVDLFFSVGITDGVQGGSVDPSRDFPPCPNFADDACPAAVRLNTLGYPDAATLRLARHASVSTYLRRVKAPTLLVQGQKDTLFNLQEAVATYRGLKAQGTPTRMIWQSWGHSDSTPAPGELDFDARSLRDSYLGNRFLNWMNHYVKGNAKAPVGPGVLVLPRLGPLRHPARVRRHRGAQGVRRAVPLHAEPDGHPLLHRQRRAHHQQRGDAGQRVVRQRRPGAHVVLRDLGPRGQPGEQPAERRSRHRRLVHERAARRPGGPGRLAAAAAAPVGAGRRADPGQRTRAASWCCSRRSTTSPRTGRSRCTTGSSPRCGSPT